MITFEEYKKKFEIFCKIDSPEKLAICQSQYKNQLLHIEAQNHFEPFEYKSEDDILSRYEKNLFSILPFDKITETQLSLLIRPSFEPESLLIIDKKQNRYALSYSALVTNYWYLFYENANITNVEKKTVSAELRYEIGDKLYALIDAAILEARKPVGGGFVLDGVKYIFTKIVKGKQLSVFKHSPIEDSKTANIIDIMQHLIDNITALDEPALTTLENLLERCSSE